MSLPHLCGGRCRCQQSWTLKNFHPRPVFDLRIFSYVIMCSDVIIKHSSAVLNGISNFKRSLNSFNDVNLIYCERCINFNYQFDNKCVDVFPAGGLTVFGISLSIARFVKHLRCQIKLGVFHLDKRRQLQSKPSLKNYQKD